MIVDERTYTLQIGAVGKYLKLYEATGMTIQRRILGNLLGFYSTEVGTLNQIVHLWGYESMDDRNFTARDDGAAPRCGRTRAGWALPSRP